MGGQEIFKYIGPALLVTVGSIAPDNWASKPAEGARAWVTPAFPEGSMIIIMSVLGAVVMSHDLFLHSEMIQSRQWNLNDDAVIRRPLRYEYVDTACRLGDQQRHDPAGRRDLFRNENTHGRVAAGRPAAATAAGAKRQNNPFLP